MAIILCSLTACGSDDYNDNQTGNSTSSSDNEDEVYEYQQIIDEGGTEGGQAEYGFSFSDAEDAD